MVEYWPPDLPGDKNRVPSLPASTEQAQPAEEA